MKKVCEYEIGGPGLLPLHNKSTLIKEEGSSDTDSDNLSTACHQPSFLHMHPHLTSCKQLETMCRKAHLVMRLIEMRIGQEPLLQVDKKFFFISFVNRHFDGFFRMYGNWEIILFEYDISQRCHLQCDLNKEKLPTAFCKTLKLLK